MLSELSQSRPLTPAASTRGISMRLDDGWPAVALAVVLTVLALQPALAPLGTAAALLLLCRLAIARMARSVHDDALARILTAAFYTRAVLAAVLYAASLAHWPLFQSLQLGEGFWLFATDATHNHAVANEILQAWELNALFPRGHGAGLYYLLVAGEYRLTGPYLLHGVAFNVGFAMSAAFLAYVTGRRLGGDRAGRRAAVLVGFWPSSILWSTQLLREAETMFLVLCGLYLLVRLYQDTSAGAQAPQWVRLTLALLALGPTLLVLVSGPSLYALTMTVACISVFVPLAVRAWAFTASRRFRSIVLLATVVLAIGGTFAGRSVEFMYLFQPSSDVDLQVQKERAAREALQRPPQPQEMSGGAPDQVITSAPAFGDRLPGLSATVDKVGLFTRRLSRLPWELASLREGQRVFGGSNPLYPDADVSTLPKMLAFIPKALAAAFVAPFPWDLYSGDYSGALRYVSVLESLLMYPLVAVAVVAFVRARRRGEFWLLLTYSLIGMTVLGLTMVNIGGLFRYRVAFVVALMLIASTYRASEAGSTQPAEAR